MEELVSWNQKPIHWFQYDQQVAVAIWRTHDRCSQGRATIGANVSAKLCVCVYIASIMEPLDC